MEALLRTEEGEHLSGKTCNAENKPGIPAFLQDFSQGGAWRRWALGAERGWDSPRPRELAEHSLASASAEDVVVLRAPSSHLYPPPKAHGFDSMNTPRNYPIPTGEDVYWSIIYNSQTQESPTSGDNLNILIGN